MNETTPGDELCWACGHARFWHQSQVSGVYGKWVVCSACLGTPDVCHKFEERVMTDREHSIDKKFGHLLRLSERLEDRAATLRRHAEQCLHEAENIMPGINELNDAIASLKAKVEADEAADAALVVTLNAQIADLQAQLAAGTPIDTQAQIDALQQIADELVP